jgi:hypothetical protein
VNTLYRGPLRDFSGIDDKRLLRYRLDKMIDCNGLTCLRDSIILATNSISEPGKIVVLTDGTDTCSRATCNDVKKSVRKASERGVSVLLIGSNQDAVVTGKELGIDESYCLTYSDGPCLISAMRAASDPEVHDRGFTQAQREESQSVSTRTCGHFSLNLIVHSRTSASVCRSVSPSIQMNAVKPKCAC